ncbi:MAG: cysteine--tRNA ligase [Candidatus Peregrinibacteria bacterium]|nr:cysteine--tRNA ligase [Candidatus Peregrinibacteria bacterium]
MPLVLYNTYSKKEEEFTPLKPGIVTMYTCGPTVYGRPHIGNYSSFLMADLLRRWLEVGHGYTVTHVKNITDVGHLVHDADAGDDKVQKQAEKERVHPLAIARRYEGEFLEDEQALRIQEPAHRPRASEYIKEQLAMVKILLQKNHAYETEDGVYFSVSTFPRYGALSGNTLENLSAGARIEVDEKKKHPADFALWKKCVGENGMHVLRWSFASGDVSTSEGEDPSSGFPGWHIECSAMSRALLGEQLDIHTGGEDNIFPHHECEIAQSECSGKSPFVRYWLHKRRIDLGDQKMSKSLGNVLSISDITAKGFSPLDLRYSFLSVHYRTNLKFSWKGLENARTARRSIVEWMNTPLTPDAKGRDSTDDVSAFSARFADAMDDDLNTSAALAAVFDCMHWSRSVNHSSATLDALQAFTAVVRDTFGCFEAEEETVPANVLALAKEREDARARKDFSASDRLREEIRAFGFEVRDGGGEQTLRKL